jgi:hypothetical protein
MGFAYDETGLPVIDAPQASYGPSADDGHAWPISAGPDEQGTDDGIGEILLQVQRFADETAEEAQRNAHAVVDAARAEADRILEASRRQAERDAQAIVEAGRAEATSVLEESRQQAIQYARATVDAARAEASRVLEQSGQQRVELGVDGSPSVSPDAVADLSNAIAEFASTNRELIDELVQLRNALERPSELAAQAEVASRPSPFVDTPNPAPVLNGNAAALAHLQ